MQSEDDVRDWCAEAGEVLRCSNDAGSQTSRITLPLIFHNVRCLTKHTYTVCQKMRLA